LFYSRSLLIKESLEFSMRKVRNITILQSLFFGRGTLPSGLKLERNKCEVATQLPLTKTGLIKVGKKPHFEIGLGAALKDSKIELAPKSYRGIIEVRSVIQEGTPFKDIDDGIDVLPDAFLDSMGVLNDEIEASSGAVPLTQDSLVGLLVPPGLKNTLITVEELRTLKGWVDVADSLDLDAEELVVRTRCE
jgi:hypothetical protein